MALKVVAKSNYMYKQVLNEKVHFKLWAREQAACAYKENGRDATFDLSIRVKIMKSASNHAELLTQVTARAHLRM